MSDESDPDDTSAGHFTVRVGRAVGAGYNVGVQFTAICERCGAEMREHGWWGKDHLNGGVFNQVHGEFPFALGSHVCGQPDQRRDVRSDWPMNAKKDPRQTK